MPSKEDYWSACDIRPEHKIIRGLSRSRFRYIWRNFHVSFTAEEEPELDDIDDDKEEDDDKERGELD